MQQCMWRLANSVKQPGSLGKVNKFLDAPASIAACSVEIPIESNDAVAVGAVGGLVSEGVRSLELWWNGQHLDIVLAAGEHNLEPYKQAFSIMYPSARFVPLKNPVPKWYDERHPYHYFDVSWRHGHFAGTIKDAKWFTSQIASAIQINQHAWVQMAWCTRDLSGPMMRYADAFAGAKAANADNQDFVKNATAIGNDIQDKTQGPHVILSIRGLCDFGAAELDADYSIRSVHATGGRSLEDNPDIPDDELYVKPESAEHDDGILAGGTDGIGILPFEGISSAYDHLVKNRYAYRLMWRPDGDPITVGGKLIGQQRGAMFAGRMVPDPSETLKRAISHYVGTDVMGKYHDRASLPYMILKPSDLITFARLPDGKTRNVTVTRGVVIPTMHLDSTGFNMGFFQAMDERISYEDYHVMFGRMVVSADAEAFVASKADFEHHIYASGATGSGKTSVIKCFAKHLEMGNIYASMPRDKTVSELRASGYKHLHGLDGNKTLDDLDVGYENAFIYFDPKGDDSEGFIRMCEPETMRSGKVRYLDPTKTGFSINPLELPPHTKSNKESLVALYVGHFTEMVSAWYGDPGTFVRMERILKVFMQYLYINRDNPTLLDVYTMVSRLQDDKNYLRTIYEDMGQPTPVLEKALESVAGLEPKAFDPLLNRLETFAIDPLISRTFAVKHSTISMDELIKPGSYTIVRFSESDLPIQFVNMAMQTFVLHLWYAIEKRSTLVPENERTQVVLALDEFDKLKGITALGTIIQTARSKKLGLILAHQNLKQLQDDLLSKITGNFGLQMAGRLEGADASRLGTAWDPKYKDDLTKQIASQPKYRWTAKATAGPGKEQPLPLQFWTHYNPEIGGVLKNNISSEEFEKFCKSEKKSYTPKQKDIDRLHDSHNMWMKNLDVDFIHEREWAILIEVYAKPCKLKDLTPLFDGAHRDEISALCKKMVRRKLLTRIENVYVMSDHARKTWFDINPHAIGKSADIHECMLRCVQHHLSKKHFVGLASQKVQKGKNRTDLIAYDYVNQKAISLEIESEVEAETHSHQVVKNMLKWPELNFHKCEVWSFNPIIQKIYDDQKAIEEQKKEREEPHNLSILENVTIRVLSKDSHDGQPDDIIQSSDANSDPTQE